MKKPNIDKSVHISGDVTNSPIHSDLSRVSTSTQNSPENQPKQNQNSGLIKSIFKYGILPFVWLLIELFTEYGIIQKLFGAG